MKSKTPAAVRKVQAMVPAKLAETCSEPECELCLQNARELLDSIANLYQAAYMAGMRKAKKIALDALVFETDRLSVGGWIENEINRLKRAAKEGK